MPRKEEQEVSSVSDLKEQKRLIELEIKKQARLEAEIGLELAVSEFTSNDNPDTRVKLRSACYKYIATHRSEP